MLNDRNYELFNCRRVKDFNLSEPFALFAVNPQYFKKSTNYETI